ncbi:hypothetical protein AWM75_07860 [Aerococcus urinaehominis]|uniref:Insertion element IS150 protein InsJ-like helix-turn-helix domain-containing protein n=1 Tax=Aerococcus urinaehominis TaxID=128944 RepID=A0A0X8FM66_9LACT|nr:sigma-70 family RNA polymerase sigma factor [Aerococcus urinaehominis]AMB99887.1 hypothetical protein AWM75_07860 [Aerococcus urinaehominis]SDM53030.1 RNA polymerase sigma factor, sigma-70 family [Aerococcus urinaehominis]
MPHTSREEKIIRKFTPLVCKTIYRLGIASHHIHFDDYYQELAIKLLALTKTFKGDPLASDSERYQFVGYAAVGLRRYMYDLLRKEKHPDSPNWLADDQRNLSLLETNLQAQEFLNHAQEALTDREWQLLVDLVAQDMTMTDLAAHYQVSRKTLYQWKNKLAQKLAPYKEILETDQ